MGKIVKLHSKQDAIEKTKHCGWCTAFDSDHYWNKYSRNGDLFVYYKDGKRRPSFQMFFPKPDSGLSFEIKKKGNNETDVDDLNSIPDLCDFISEMIGRDNLAVFLATLTTRRKFTIGDALTYTAPGFTVIGYFNPESDALPEPSEEISGHILSVTSDGYANIRDGYREMVMAGDSLLCNGSEWLVITNRVDTMPFPPSDAAVTAITTAISESIPLSHYLPAIALTGSFRIVDCSHIDESGYASMMVAALQERGESIRVGFNSLPTADRSSIRITTAPDPQLTDYMQHFNFEYSLDSGGLMGGSAFITHVSHNALFSGRPVLDMGRIVTDTEIDVDADVLCRETGITYKISRRVMESSAAGGSVSDLIRIRIIEAYHLIKIKAGMDNSGAVTLNRNLQWLE